MHITGQFIWAAIMRDGRVMDQFLHGRERSISEVDHGDVQVLSMHPVHSRVQPVRVELRPGERLIKFWRRSCSVNEFGLGIGGETVTDVVGIQTASGDKVYLAIKDNGNMVLTTESEHV